MLQKAVFLDRDGVINRDTSEYVKSWSEFEFLPGSLSALRHLTANGFATIVVTNQSIVNRRMVPKAVLEDIHARMAAAVEEREGRIRDILYCPHRPDERCDCRKPKPRLVLRARDAHGIDLASAVMIGDSAKDIECAQNAGCGCAILVRTGNGIEAEEILKTRRRPPDHILPDLDAAARWVVGNHSRAKL